MSVTNFFEEPPPPTEEDYGNIVPMKRTRAKKEVLLGEGWRAEWQISDTGTPLPNLFNAMVCMRRYERLREIVSFDDMERAPVLNHTPPGIRSSGTYPRPLTDGDVIAIQEEMQRQGLRRIAKATVQDAVSVRADECRVHPVRDYLDGLTWDGTTRIAGWLSTYLGVDGGPYADTIGKLFLIAMVARIYRPGCKSDYMLILEGEQGARKSSACSIMAGRWFSDSLPDIRSKDAISHLRGKWLVEVAELSATDKATSDTIKAFVTRAIERYRPSYGRLDIVEPRQCIFVGTTNKATYLKDDTGNRRYWPVKVGTLDLEALGRDRDQLLAEAVACFKAGEQWWPDRDFERAHIVQEQESRFEEDPWINPIANWIQRENINRCTAEGVAIGAICLDLAHIGTKEHRRIISCLGKLGWSMKRLHGVRWYFPAEKS